MENEKGMSEIEYNRKLMQESDEESLKIRSKYFEKFYNFRKRIERNIDMSKDIRNGIYQYHFIVSVETNFELRLIVDGSFEYTVECNKLFGINITKDINKKGDYFKAVLQFKEN